MEDARAIVEEHLRKARETITDSPGFELAENFPEADHTKTDVFRDRVQYSAAV